MPIGDFAGGFAEGFGSGGSGANEKRLRDALNLQREQFEFNKGATLRGEEREDRRLNVQQEQFESTEARLQRAQELQEEIANRQHQLQLRSTDLQVSDWMLKVLDSNIPKPARQFMLKQGATRLLGLDPKSEAYKDFEKMLLASDPDTLQSWKEIVTGAFPDMEPGQAHAFARAAAMGKVELTDIFNMQKPGDVQLEQVADPESSTGRRYVPRQEAVGQEAPAPSAQTQIVMPPGEKAEAKGLAELDVEEAKQIRESAASARQVLPPIRQFRAAIEAGRFTPGTAAGIRETLSRAAEFVGMNPEELGLGAAASAETMQAASRQIALTMAEDVSRLTNMSLQFIIDAVPNATRTPEGNRIILDLMEATADRAIKIGKLQEQYINDYGSLRRVPEGVPTFFEARDNLVASFREQDEELRGRLENAAASGAGMKWSEVPGMLSGGTTELRRRLEQAASKFKHVARNPQTDELMGSNDGKTWTPIDE